MYKMCIKKKKAERLDINTIVRIMSIFQKKEESSQLEIQGVPLKLKRWIAISGVSSILEM